MQLVRQGDRKSFEELYKRFSQRLLHYFFRMLGGDADKAQDFLQSLFLKIIERPHQFNARQNFSSWIYSIAFNMCKNEYRHKGIRRKLALDLEYTISEELHPHDSVNTEQAIDQEKFKGALLRELQKIGSEHRSTFILRFQENLSIKEISDVIGCSEGTVKSRLFYTTKKLAKNLKAYHPYKFEVNEDDPIELSNDRRTVS